MFYEKDTDIKSIMESPEFWGLIRNGRCRIPVCILIMIMSLMQVMSKTSSTVLLWSIKGIWVLLYFVVDHGIFIGYKLYFNDFLYATPVEGNFKYVFAFICRFFFKLVVDFTRCLTARHPYGLGGAYYTFNAFMTQASAFPIAYLYSKYSHAPIPLSKLCQFFSCTFLVWFVSFVLFLFLIEPKFRKTFYSKKTGCDVAKAYFLANEDDAHKVLIFGTQQDKWIDIAPEVEIWSHSKWAGWKTSKPEWFTDNFVASVPDRYIPKDVVVELNRVAGGQRRRSSVRNSLLLQGGGNDVTPAPVVVSNDDDILARVEEGGAAAEN